MLQLVRETAGDTIPDDCYDDMVERRTKLERQSFEVASKLQEGGVPAFDNKSDISVVSLITGQRKPVEGYRNITFIPVIAKKRRSKTLRRLEYFVSQPEQEGKVRMWVFNTGHKVPLGECRELSLIHI